MIQLQNIQKKYGNKVVLQDVSYSFDKNNLIYTITGKSGSGKTTLFNILFGIDQQFDGMYLFNDRNIEELSETEWDILRNRSISIVYQDFKLLDALSVYDNLYFSYALTNESVEETIDEILEKLNLNHVKNSKISAISGGEKQRLAIARAILNKPEYLLLDEPTSNLDNDNAYEILRYLDMLKKDNMTIIIITHDNRVEEFSDIALHLEDGLLHVKETRTSDNKHDAVELKQNQKVGKYKHLFSYFIKSLKSRVENIAISNIPICVIFCIVIVAYGIASSSYQENLNILFNGLSDKAVYISANDYTEEYREQNLENRPSISDDGKRIAFSNEDVENVESIPHVETVRLYNGVVKSLYDNEEMMLSLVLNKKDFTSNLATFPGYSNAPEAISFSFESLITPTEFIRDFNQDEVTLKYGHFPAEKTNEILIPDIYAIQYFGDAKDYTGKKIKLNTVGNSGNKEEKEYTITGIYQTSANNFFDHQYPFYVPYHDDSKLEYAATTEFYLMVKESDAQGNLKVPNYHNPLYESYESYLKAIGTNYPNMIIRIDDANNHESVSKELKKLFPNLKIASQYELSTGKYASAFQTVEKMMLWGSIAIAIVLGIIITFLNRGYIKQRNREFAILYSIGYSRKQGVFLIIWEYLIMTTINLVIAYGILIIANVVYFRTSPSYMLFNYIFDGGEIVKVVALTFIINLVSSIFTLNGIKKKKLKKYLEVN